MTEQEKLALISELMKKSEVKECFYHKKDECKGDIKYAHSISKANRLDLIKGIINNNEKVYSLSQIISEEGEIKRGVKGIGWKNKASIFPGFCDWHDTTLFEPIENGHDFNESPEHCFLHSYRSFVYSFYSVKRSYKAAENMLDYISESPLTDRLKELPKKCQLAKEGAKGLESTNIPFPKEAIQKQFGVVAAALKPILDKAPEASAEFSLDKVNSYQDFYKYLDKASSLMDRYKSVISQGKRKLNPNIEKFDDNQEFSWIYWMSKYKAILDYMIENKSYTGLKYFCKVKDQLFPFACAFSYAPNFLFSGMDNLIFPKSDPDEVINSSIMVTVLPDRNKTIILFSCFDGDRQAEFYLKTLFSLKKDEDFEKAVTSIIIENPSNVFLNPTMWGKFGARQEILKDEINIKRPIGKLPEKPFMSQLNFFSNEFSAEELGILV